VLFGAHFFGVSSFRRFVVYSLIPRHGGVGGVGAFLSTYPNQKNHEIVAIMVLRTRLSSLFLCGTAGIFSAYHLLQAPRQSRRVTMQAEVAKKRHPQIEASALLPEPMVLLKKQIPLSAVYNITNQISGMCSCSDHQPTTAEDCCRYGVLTGSILKRAM